MLPFTNVRQSVTDEAVCLIATNALTLEPSVVFIEEKLH